ncbi:hypothetical protein [Streptomyces virginiae]|uniref:hypothetical protein n=1 Tax=Streptomyces virginiae TaxID=1961 RepID=UPI003791A5D4
MPEPTRRRLTESEHDRAWHAIEGIDWAAGPDPDTVLNAVLAALDIDPPAGDDAAAPPYPDVFEWMVERRGDTDWLVASTQFSRHDRAVACLAARQQSFPSAQFRILRIATTYRAEPASSS